MGGRVLVEQSCMRGNDIKYINTGTLEEHRLFFKEYVTIGEIRCKHNEETIVQVAEKKSVIVRTKRK